MSERICALVICYNDHDDLDLPPWLALVTERERNEWLQQRDIGRFWNPTEYTTYPGFAVVPDDEQEIKDACRLANREMRARSEWYLGRKMLNQVAAKLATRDWSPMLTTDDFIVFAVDLKAQDLEDNLRQSVAWELVQTFRANGWI